MNQGLAPVQDGEGAGSAARPRIAALVLAAGRSRRMGPENKLLLHWQGQPLVRHVLANVLASRVCGVVVVTGHERARVEAALVEMAEMANLAGLSEMPGLAGRKPPVCRLVHNPRFSAGMASSLGVGLQALPEDVDGVLVCLGDMPRVRPGHLDLLMGRFAHDAARPICIPTYQGRRGNPVLLGRQLFPALLELDGDRGAGPLIRRHPGLVHEVAVGDDGILQDVDTPAALARLLAEDHHRQNGP